MSNDLISREGIKKATEGYRMAALRDETSAEVINRVAWNAALECVLVSIRTIPAVPQEMSAVEFVATISDMCINQFPAGCAPCPLYVAGHGCGEKILPPDEAVAIVEKWAKEHPERSEE